VTLPAAGFDAICGTGSLLYGFGLYSNGSVSQGNARCYLSTDGGVTWQTRGAITTALSSGGGDTVYAAMYEDHLYVCFWSSTGDSGASVYYSTDGGATFTESAITVSGYYPSGIAVDSDGHVLALTTTTSGSGATKAYLSTDSGATFALKSTISDKIHRWVAIAANDNVIISGTSGIQLSTDSGATWTAKLTSAAGKVVASGTDVLATYTGSIIKYSEDSGATWSTGDAIAVSVGLLCNLCAYTGGWATMSGTTVYLSTDVTGFVATTQSPGTNKGIYVVEEA